MPFEKGSQHYGALIPPSVRTKQTVFRIYGAVKQREIEECSIPPSSNVAVDRRANCIAGNSRGSFGEGRFINIDQPPITPPPPPSSTPVTLPTDPKDEWNPPGRRYRMVLLEKRE